jgi:protein-glutamine gamma-glutamyltransferase
MTRARLLCFLPLAVCLGVFLHSYRFGALNIAFYFAIGLMIAGGVVCFAVDRPQLRAHAVTALGLFAMVALGQTRVYATYALGTVAFVVSSMLAMRFAATPGTFGRNLDRRRIGLTLGLAIAAALFAAWFLPVLQRPIERYATDLVARSQLQRTGFGGSLNLNSTKELQESQQVVMRIYGPPVDYLRGSVFRGYDGWRWQAGSLIEREVASPSLLGDNVSRVVFARPSMYGGRGPGSSRRLFLPMNACAVHTPSGLVRVHGVGEVFETGEITRTYEFVAGDCSPAVGPVPPSAEDLAVPPKLRGFLSRTAEAWTQPSMSDEEKVAALMRELGKFPYDLNVQRDPKVDPIVDFLTVHKRGHCEFFASSLALLARSMGIPTRVIAGYRVAEHSPALGYSVVRERNAHAWVEAYIDGRFVRFDPTPPAVDAALRAPSRFGVFWELLAGALDGALLRAGWEHAVGVVLLLAAVFAAGRIVRARRGRITTRAVVLKAAESLPAYHRFELALGRMGISRAPWEPIEALGRRLAASPDARIAVVADTVLAYADLRYGGIGSEPEISARLAELARDIEAKAQAERQQPESGATPGAGVSP